MKADDQGTHTGEVCTSEPPGERDHWLKIDQLQQSIVILKHQSMSSSQREWQYAAETL